MNESQLATLLLDTHPPDYVVWNQRRIVTCVSFLAEHLKLDALDTLDLGHDVHVGYLLKKLGCRLIGNVAPAELGGHESAREVAGFADRSGNRSEWRLDEFDFERPFPYPEQTFDLVTALEVIEHVQIGPRTFLREIKRVLRPGGHLFIGTPNVACWTKIMRQFAHAPIYDAKPYSQDFGDRHPMCHVYEYTPWELKYLLKSEGFEIKAFATWNAHAMDPTGVRAATLRALVALSLLITGHVREAALMFRHRGHQIGLVAQLAGRP